MGRSTSKVSTGAMTRARQLRLTADRAKAAEFMAGCLRTFAKDSKIDLNLGSFVDEERRMMIRVLSGEASTGRFRPQMQAWLNAATIGRKQLAKEVPITDDEADKVLELVEKLRTEISDATEEAVQDEAVTSAVDLELGDEENEGGSDEAAELQVDTSPEAVREFLMEGINVRGDCKDVENSICQKELKEVMILYDGIIPNFTTIISVDLSPNIFQGNAKTADAIIELKNLIIEALVADIIRRCQKEQVRTSAKERLMEIGRNRVKEIADYEENFYRLLVKFQYFYIAYFRKPEVSTESRRETDDSK